MVKEAASLLRRKLFFSLDWLQGSVVRRAYERLKEFEDLDSNSQKILKYQEGVLKELLKDAVNNTEFYSVFKGKDFKEFPVINKSIIKTNEDGFISGKYNKSKLVVMFTSGSTGTPFRCYQDKVKKKHVIAELIYYSEKVGYRLGENLTYIRGFSEGNYRSKLKQWLHNQTLILMTKLDDLSIEKMMKKINSGSESVILGYGTTYDSWKNYFQRNGSTIVDKEKIKGIISNGEMLFDDTRESMEQAFDCRCYSRYSNQENGVIGQDDGENNVFIVNESHYIVEILKMDRDEPSVEGEVGRIVLTDLYNRAMPIIRYDTGDIGSFNCIEYRGRSKRIINNFGGRREDVIYDCEGKLLSASVIELSFEAFPEVTQFQFIQESRVKYRAKINISNEFKDSEKLIKSLKKFIGQEAEVAMEFVDEIPILASGKRKMIINLNK